MRNLIVVLLSLFFSIALFAQEETELTIYNQNFALVKDTRYFNLKKGLNTIQFSDVAEHIDPTSVRFVSLTAPKACNILEQSYKYDLVNSNRLLFKYIDLPIQVTTVDDKAYSGNLLSYDSNNLILSTTRGLQMIARQDNIKHINFDISPEELITKPTLLWVIDSGKRGKHLVEVSYLTDNINWQCEYVILLDKEDKTLELDSWVSLNNQSGVTYKDATLKLAAGTVQRMPQERAYHADIMMMKSAEPRFEGEEFFEYYLYNLDRKTTIEDSQIKQITFFSSKDIPVTKRFILDFFDGLSRSRYYLSDEVIKKNARVELELTNNKKSNLGMPMPAGKVKVYKEDKDKKLQFVGEDFISHTSKDEKIELYIGDAFDVVGERKRTDFTEQKNSMKETFELSLRNRKKEDIEIKVLEKLGYHANWKVLKSSVKWEKEDASTIVYVAKIPKNSEAKITYTVRYWWHDK